MTRKGGHEYWEERATSFDELQRHITGEETDREIERWLLDKMEDGDTVLDLGCGTGRYTAIIVDSVRHVTAADMAPAMLDEARKKLGDRNDVAVREEDCFNTSFEEGSFDAVLLANVLHIVSWPEWVMLEAFRLVRPGGHVLAIDYTGKGMSVWASLKMTLRYLRTWGMPPSTGRMLGPVELTDLAQRVGFEVEESTLLGAETKAACLHARKPASDE